jgi:hypothetical protein
MASNKNGITFFLATMNDKQSMVDLMRMRNNYKMRNLYQLTIQPPIVQVIAVPAN